MGPETGDAHGTTPEFTPPRKSEHVTDILDGGFFNPGPCQWTAVTAAAGCGRIAAHFSALEDEVYTNGISVVYPYGKVGSRAIP